MTFRCRCVFSIRAFASIFLSALAVFCGATLSAGNSPINELNIEYLKTSVASKNCADALRAGILQAGIPGLKAELRGYRDDAEFGADDYGHLIGGGSIVVSFFHPGSKDALSALSIPYLFRDPNHFQAFLQSNLYRKFRNVDQIRGSSKWLALAYGGSTQLFSDKVAMTEPAHFKTRVIATRNQGLYDKFGAETTDLDSSFRNSPNAIEMPLLDVSKDEFFSNIHFVNLTFSQSNFLYFDFTGAPSAARQRLAAIADAAALSCSAMNFRAEQELLQRFKSQGMTVVPVNRAAFAPTGWQYGITHLAAPEFETAPEYLPWTLSDLDELVRLGNESGQVLPSSVYPKLPRAAQRTLDESANAPAVPDFDAVRSKVRADWSAGIATLVNAIRLAGTKNEKMAEAVDDTADVELTPAIYSPQSDFEALRRSPYVDTIAQLYEQRADTERPLGLPSAGSMFNETIGTDDWLELYGLSASNWNLAANRVNELMRLRQKLKQISASDFSAKHSKSRVVDFDSLTAQYLLDGTWKNSATGSSLTIKGQKIVLPGSINAVFGQGQSQVELTAALVPFGSAIMKTDEKRNISLDSETKINDKPAFRCVSNVSFSEDGSTATWTSFSVNGPKCPEGIYKKSS